MRFIETPLAGAFVIELEVLEDERGYFARTFCVEEFAKRGLVTAIAQCSVSFNARKGTLRGLHYQAAPHGEVKLVRCTRGAIFDVIVDLREEAETFGTWYGVELTAANGRMLYIPKGMAHGFQTLMDESEVAYQMSETYHPERARGVRWDDARIGVRWPEVVKAMSERDRSLPGLENCTVQHQGPHVA